MAEFSLFSSRFELRWDVHVARIQIGGQRAHRRPGVRRFQGAKQLAAWLNGQFQAPGDERDQRTSREMIDTAWVPETGHELRDVRGADKAGMPTAMQTKDGLEVARDLGGKWQPVTPSASPFQQSGSTR